jgi:predicted regulator of Ras-like GTPase activity (Roadblock/LC7/MglB family)
MVGEKKITTEDRKAAEKYLKELKASVPEIQSAVIVSTQGIPIAAVLPANSNESQVAAMVAVLQNLGKKAAKEWLNGDIEQVFIRGSKGYLIVQRRGPYSLLAISATKDLKLGLIFSDNFE